MDNIISIIAFIVFAVILVAYYMFRDGYFNRRADKSLGRELEQAQIKNRLAEMERLKVAEAAGEYVHKPRRKSRRMQNRRR